MDLINFILSAFYSRLHIHFEFLIANKIIHIIFLFGQILSMECFH